MGFKTAASEEDVLSPISASIKTHSRDRRLELQTLPLMLSLTFTAGALYSLTHLSALTWNTEASTSCIPQAQQLPWPHLHLTPKAHLSYTPHKSKELSWVLPCSSCSTHCLHLLLLETPNATPVHSGPKDRGLKSPQPPSPCLGGHCNTAAIPAALSHQWYKTRWQPSCCPFYPPQHGSMEGKRKAPARDHNIFHTQSNQPDVFEHQWVFWTLP